MTDNLHTASIIDLILIGIVVLSCFYEMWNSDHRLPVLGQ